MCETMNMQEQAQAMTVARCLVDSGASELMGHAHPASALATASSGHIHVQSGTLGTSRARPIRGCESTLALSVLTRV